MATKNPDVIDTNTRSRYTICKWTATGSGTWNLPYGVSTFEVLVVAGGGGAGGGKTAAAYPAGGGGGEVYYTSTFVPTSTEVTVSVGRGGDKNDTSNVDGYNGDDSIFGTITSHGGHGGCIVGNGGYSGDGHAGGVKNGVGAGGGGGDSQNGSNAPSTSLGGAGGNGTAYTITGSSVYYGGGGGGGSTTTAGAGGLGGGGGGGTLQGTNGLGGGGGGGTGISSGSGGSGAVIIAYLIPESNLTPMWFM